MPVIIQRSFTSGEISPSLQSRADLVKYSTGLNLCENFFVRAQGGVYSRPGFKYIDEVADSSKKVKLIPFSSSSGEFVLVFNNGVMRVIKDDAYVLVLGVPYELVYPLSDVNMDHLSYTQQGEVMTLASGVPHGIIKLERIADDNWTLTAASFASTASAPLHPITTAYVITNVTQANPAVVTTSGVNSLLEGQPIATAAVVGMTELNGNVYNISIIDSTHFELIGIDSTAYTAYVSGGTATGEPVAQVAGTLSGSPNKTYSYNISTIDGVESLIGENIEFTTNALSETGGVKLSWNVIDGAQFYRIYKASSPDSLIYGWIGDSKTGFFEDYNIAPLTSVSPYEDYQPFISSSYDVPWSVGSHDQRLIFGGSFSYPSTVYATQVGDYSSLRSSRVSRDDDALEFTILGKRVGAVRHIISLDVLLIFSSRGEWIIGDGQDRVLTPSTISARAQSYHGSSNTNPVIVNDSVVFVQGNGKKIREFTYNGYNGLKISEDVSLTAEHLFKGYTIDDMAYFSEPYGIVWCVRSDGVLLGMTRQQEHQVTAWHQHTTDGEFENVTTIAGSGLPFASIPVVTDDIVYVVVKRIINSVTKRYIERLMPREETASEDCFYVDSGLTYDGAPATVISDLGHLEGEAVAVLADGDEVTGLTVSSGAITLPRAASKVHIGLAYTPAIELLDIEQASTETLKSRSVSVSKVVVEVEKSRGGFVGPRKDGEDTTSIVFHEIQPRFISDSYDPITLKTYKAEVIIEPQWSRGGGVRIEQRSPLPLTILSVIPQVDIGGN